MDPTCLPCSCFRNSGIFLKKWIRSLLLSHWLSSTYLKFQQLISVGIPRICIRIILFIYMFQFSNVSWKDTISNSLSLWNGVRQGLILSGILNGFYVNGIFEDWMPCLTIALDALWIQTGKNRSCKCWINISNIVVLEI